MPNTFNLDTVLTARKLLDAARRPLGDLTAVMASPPTISNPAADGNASTIQTGQGINAGMFLPNDPSRVTVFGGPVYDQGAGARFRIQTIMRAGSALNTRLQPGTAGGIMSWRGPRYQALAATGDLSAPGQARFFLQENPDLIAALNNAKSVEEAQGLMNKAWAFAGYNRPGGETARRLSLAQGYLPQFQGQGGAEVASLDPSAGMTTAVGAIDTIAPPSGTVAPEQPVFDAGRFSDPIKLAEMPAGRNDMAARLDTQASSFAPPLPPAILMENDGGKTKS